MTARPTIDGMPAPSPATLQRSRILSQLTSLRGTRLVAAAAILLSMTLAAMMGEVINRDGIIYVRAAQAFLDGGLEAAMQVYNWPAYSILFALLSRLSGLSLETSAHLVNAALMVLLADAFIRLCARLAPQTARPWVAALVFLSFPPLSHSLEIYRDWGYLAFAVFAAVPMVRFWQDERGRAADALLWQAGIGAATLFRVEGAVLLALTPLALLFQARPWPLRLRRALLAGGWTVPPLLAALALISSNAAALGKLIDLLTYANPDIVFAAFNDAAQRIAQALNKYTDDFAPYMLASGIVTMAAWMTVKNLGAFLFVLTLYGLYRFGLPRQRGFGLIYTWLAIVALILFVYLATRLTIVGRYGLFAACLLLTVTSVLVSRLFEPAAGEGRPRRWLRFAVLAGLLLGAAATIGARPDYKAYIRDGGLWIRNELPADATVITNDYIIDYYAGRPHGPKLDSLAKVRDQLQATAPPYYVALRLDDEQLDEARTLFPDQPVRAFRSSRAAESLLIFHVGQR